MKTTKAEQAMMTAKAEANQIISLSQLSDMCKDQNQLWFKIKAGEVKYIGYSTYVENGKKIFVTV